MISKGWFITLFGKLKTWGLNLQIGSSYFLDVPMVRQSIYSLPSLTSLAMILFLLLNIVYKNQSCRFY